MVNNSAQAVAKSKSSNGGRANEKDLTIETYIADHRLKIVISDSGAGISKEHLEKIFEPLFSTKSFGVGLGLPIVKGILEQHSGDIEIESTLNVGTKVTLSLPLN
jgi:signal transduction histidine kinase